MRWRSPVPISKNDFAEVVSLGDRLAKIKNETGVDGFEPRRKQRKVDLHAVMELMAIEGAENYYPGPDKAPPLPNPVVQAEQLKLQAKQMQFQHEKQMLAIELMEQRRLNEAKIAQLHTQSMKLMAEIGVDRAAIEIQAFDSAIAALQAHNEMLSEKSKALTGEIEDDQRGRVPGVAGPSSDAGLPAGLGGMEGERKFQVNQS